MIATMEPGTLAECCVRECSEAPPVPQTEGFVHSVETCGTVDGPGLRYVLFLKGCPLRCQYCHNPDAQGKPVGEVRTAEEVFADVLKYKSFLRSGGLTISGGEPLLQPTFVHALFSLAREAGIHTTLDTSGYVGHRASDDLLDLTDLVLLDLKSFLPATHRVATGVPIEPILKFARRLEARGNRMWIRFVLVPGLTDDPRNIHGLADFIGGLGCVDKVEILPFHKMGEGKYAQLGIPYRLSETPAPTAEEVDRAREIFGQHGVRVG